MRTKDAKIKNGRVGASAMNAPRGRPYAAGNTRGRGRPKGSRNRTGSPEQDLLNEYGVNVVRKCLALGPGKYRRSATVHGAQQPGMQGYIDPHELPAIKTAQDVDKAAEELTQAIVRGKITPNSGEAMRNIFEGRCRIIDKAQMAGRTADLEKSLASTPPGAAGGPVAGTGRSG